MANGIAAAIPATLVLFFVADVVQAPRHAPLFLVAYFAAGALGLPAWVALARRTGKVRAWAVGMGGPRFLVTWSAHAFISDPASEVVPVMHHS